MRALLVIALVACGGGTSKPATPTAATDHVMLETFAELTQGPGNIAVSPEPRVFISQHQFYDPKDPVVEIGAGRPKPFAVGAVDSVLGIRADDRGIVWLLDNGMRHKTQRKLVAWHPGPRAVERTIDLTNVSPADAFLNDLAVDRKHDAIYIADPAGGKNAALIVVDLKTNTARRVLEGHASVVPEQVDLVIDGTPVQIKQPDGSTIRPKVGVNPITLDADNEWLYFGPMHGTKLYRVRTAALRDPAAVVEPELYAERPITDGITMDTAGNIYLGDLANNAIGVIGTDRRYRVLVRDPRLSWVDAFSFGPDGWYYVVANQLHRSAQLNAGVDATKPPFRIMRFKPLAPGVVGR